MWSARASLGLDAFGHGARHDAVTVSTPARKAGAVIWGKTNVHGHGHSTTGKSFNALYGQTNNPWDWTTAAGGALISGAAAALATGMTALEIGSDISGGSLRASASFCGICSCQADLGDRFQIGGHVPPVPGHLGPNAT